MGKRIDYLLVLFSKTAFLVEMPEYKKSKEFRCEGELLTIRCNVND